MKIEINFDDEEWEKAKAIFAQIVTMRKSVTDSQSISDKATFVLKDDKGNVKQTEEGKSNA